MKKRIIILGIFIAVLCVILTFILNLLPQKAERKEQPNTTNQEETVPIVEDKTFFPEITEKEEIVTTTNSELNEKEFLLTQETFNTNLKELDDFSREFYDSLKSISSENIKNELPNYNFKNWSIIIGENNSIDVKYLPQININKMSAEQIGVFTTEIKNTMENFLLASRSNFIKDTISLNIYLDNQLVKTLKTN